MISHFFGLESKGNSPPPYFNKKGGVNMLNWRGRLNKNG